MADAKVRPAQAEDVAEIARIQRDTWRTAYGSLLPAAVLDQLTPELAEAQWAAAISRPPSPRHHVLVAMEGAWTVGFAACEPSPDEDADGHTGSIATLLVEPRWGRRGHGSRLLAAATDHLRVDALRTVTCWVYEEDRASAAFYASAGWEPSGLARVLDADGHELREVQYHADLGGPDSA
ncbi:MAG TPA: GNAT family N-acetyltransferase [Mycobacteriales bacterium]|nr:GNAT family N-acetyltransferase [Mycobacteriales bacterium]